MRKALQITVNYVIIIVEVKVQCKQANLIITLLTKKKKLS